MKFSLWLERRDEQNLKLSIQSALGELAAGLDEDEWMNINTSDLSSEIQSMILNLGEIKKFVDPSEIEDQVRSGIRIRDLLDLVIGGHDMTPPVETPPEPPQEIGF